MKMHHKKLLVGAMLPAGALLAFVAVLLVSQTATTQAVQPQSIPSHAGASLAKNSFANGEISDYVVETIQNNHISLHRGESTTVSVLLQHKTNGNGQDLVLTNFQNSVRNFGPSARVDLTPAQFDELIAKNPTTPIRGEVMTGGIMSITPGSVKLAPNASETLTMKVTLPKNTPDEMVGKSIYISPSFDINPQHPGIVPSYDTLVIEVLS